MKKILLFLIIFLYSCGSLAGDRISKNGPCPDDGYRSANGWCCKDGFMYADGEYSTIQIEDCGCPERGTRDRKGFRCCKDGYVFDEKSVARPNGSGKYDKIDAESCCPFGGERIFLTGECCKDNYEFNPKNNQYDIENSKCRGLGTGCPQGGEQVLTGECCKNNYEFNPKTNEYNLVNGNCGCPNGAFPKTVWISQCDNDRIKYCCKDGIAQYHEFKELSREICGCPPPGINVIWGDGQANECCTPDRLYRWISDGNDGYKDYRPDLCKHPEAPRLMKEYYDRRPILKFFTKLLGVQFHRALIL